MKYLVASDIHGSAYYTLKIEEIFKKGEFDRIILLGDILYHGPRNPLPEGHDPMKVVEILNRYKDSILCVRGNCDAEIDREILEFPLAADYQKIKLGKRTVLISHGHVQTPDKHLPLRKGDIFLYGHYHVPRCELVGTSYYLNPGSCSLPKENYPQSYAILDEDRFTAYDFNGKVIKEIIFEI